MIYLSATDVVYGGSSPIVRDDRASISKSPIGMGLHTARSGTIIHQHVEFRHVRKICINTPFVFYDYNVPAISFTWSQSMFGQSGSVSASEGSEISVLGA